MNITKLIGNNILNIAIFGMILFFSSFLPTAATIGLVVMWIAYLLYSNYQIVFKVKDLSYELSHANKRGFFSEQVARTRTQLESIQGRMDVLETLEDKDTIENVCKACEEQFYTNVRYIITLMDAFDYVTKPTSQIKLINDLVNQNTLIIKKLNELIEKEIMIDKTAHDTDIEQIDDLIESLKELISQSV